MNDGGLDGGWQRRAGVVYLVDGLGAHRVQQQVLPARWLVLVKGVDGDVTESESGTAE